MQEGVKEYFNISPQDWSNRGSTVPVVEQFEEEWVGQNISFGSGDVVLDFGAGLGRWIEALHNIVREIVAVDGSERLVEFIKMRDYKNVNAVLGDETTLKRYSNYFTKVICAQVVELISDPNELFNSFYSSLKEGGELFLSTWSTDFIFVERKNDYVITPHPSTGEEIRVFYKPRSQEDVEDILKSAGFKNIVVETLSTSTEKLPDDVRVQVQNKEKVDILIVAKATKK